MKNFLSIFLFLSIFSFITGCADKPKSLGDNLVSPSDFYERVFSADADTTYKVALTNGYASRNLVGILPTGEEFITLLQFYQSSIVDSLKGAAIDTAEIRLTVSYRMLPSSPLISFHVYELQKPFSEGTFTSDSLAPSYIGTSIAATFSDSMNYLQEVRARIEDTTIIRRWADAYNDTSKPDFYGFAIKATSPTGVIGFTPFDAFSSVVPTLVVKFTRNGRADSLFFTTGQDTYVGILPPSTTFSDFEVRGGVGVRSKIKFDVSPLIQSSQAVALMIVNATLTLTVDTLSSIYSGFAPDTLFALVALSNTIIDSSNSSLFAYGAKKTSPTGERQYEFTINTIAQRWLNKLNANEGLIIRWATENSSSEKITFYSHTDTLRGPVLKIFYTQTP